MDLYPAAKWICVMPPPKRLSADQRRVDRFGVQVRGDEDNLAETIAVRLAADLFRRMETQKARRVLIALDQRGHGPAVGVPDDGLVPAHWARNDWPAMVFRSGSGERSPSDVLHGETWAAAALAMRTAIARALGTHTQREIYITARGQFAFAWLIGTLLDRSTLARLIVRNPQGGDQLDLDQGDPRYRVPVPRRAGVEVEWTPRSPAPMDRTISIALMIPRYHPMVHSFRSEVGDETPLAVRATGHISSIEDVLEIQTWIADVAEGRDVRLYTGLPFHALVFIAALSKHTIGKVTFMEYDLGAKTYWPCEI